MMDALAPYAPAIVGIAVIIATYFGARYTVRHAHDRD